MDCQIEEEEEEAIGWALGGSTLNCQWLESVPPDAPQNELGRTSEYYFR